MNKENDSFHIRSLEKKDLPLVENFFRNLTPEGKSFYNHQDCNENALKAQLKTPSPNRVDFGAMETLSDGNEKMLGHIFLFFFDTKIPWIGICLREGATGKHYGQILLQYLEDYSKAHHCGGMMLTTHATNIRAQMLYRNFGFQYLGIHRSGEMLFYKPFPSTDNPDRIL